MRDRYDFSGNFENAQISIVTHGGPPEIDIAAAIERLASIPIGQVANVGSLPDGSMMPWRPNPAFRGRDADLVKIARAYANDPGAHRAIGVTGMGGVGKSQLAAEFCHRYGSYFAGGVFWIHCGQSDGIGQQFAQLGAHLNLANDFSALPFDEKIRLTRKALEAALPRLLVLDACEDEDLLAQWRPSSGACRVLVTSRKAQWPVGCSIETVPLYALARADSVSLLRERRADLGIDDPGLTAIAGELGDLPLALHLAACFLSRYAKGSAADPRTYLNSLRSAPVLRHRSLTAGGWSPTGHEQHVAKTFSVALSQLDPADHCGQLARYILRFASRLAAGPSIPRYMLAPTAEEMAAEPDIDVNILAKQEEALHRLWDLGLLTLQDEGSAVIHPLVAAFADDTIEDIIDGTSVSERVEQYLLDLLSNLMLLKDPRETLPLSAHLRRVAELAEARGSNLTAALQLTLGHMLYEAGDFGGSIDYFARAEKLAPNLSTENSDDEIRAIGGQGISLRLLGDNKRSVELQRRALAKLEAEKPGDRGIAVTKFNLACALEAESPREAEHLLRQLVEENDREISTTNFDTLARHNAYSFRIRILTGLGKVLKDREPVEARSHLRSAAVLALSLEGPGSLERWQPLSILASIEIEEQDIESAIRHYEEAIDAITERQGAEASLLGDPLIGLGDALVLSKQYKRAREPLKRSLELIERYVGLGYPGARRATLSLAVAYIENRQFKPARTLLEKELGFLEANHGSLMNRAQALQMLVLAYAAGGDRRNAKRQRNRLAAMLNKEEAVLAPFVLDPRQHPRPSTRSK